MTKDNISLYNKNRTPFSLANLHLHPRMFVEDIFDAVEDSADFEELDKRLRKVINEPLVIDRVTNRYIRYTFTDPCGNVRYLKFRVKESIENGNFGKTLPC